MDQGDEARRHDTLREGMAGAYYVRVSCQQAQLWVRERHQTL